MSFIRQITVGVEGADNLGFTIGIDDMGLDLRGMLGEGCKSDRGSDSFESDGPGERGGNAEYLVVCGSFLSDDDSFCERIMSGESWEPSDNVKGTEVKWENTFVMASLQDCQSGLECKGAERGKQ